MKIISYTVSLGLAFLTIVHPTVGEQRRGLAFEEDFISRRILKWLYGLVSSGIEAVPRSDGGIATFFNLIRDLIETPLGFERTGVIESFLSYGDPYASGIFGPIPPKWSVEVFPDGENPVNELLPAAYNNKYAWAADFNKECGVGFMVHSTGTNGLITLRPTFPTLTFRDANGELLTRQSFRDPLESLNGPVLGLRSGLVTGCPTNNTIEAVVASVGIRDDATASTITPSSLYKVTVDLESDEMIVEPLIPDIIPFVGANSIRAVAQGIDADPCHLAFAALNENGFPPQLSPSLWTVDICAADVSSTLTETKLFLEGQPTDSLTDEQIIWDFLCDELVCWYNMVTILPDVTKASGLDLKPLLYYGTKADIAAPVGGPKEETFVPVRQIDTDDFLDASALVLEPIDQETVFACTLSGYVYQAVTASPDFDFSLENIDLALAGLELGAGQACYICDTASNDCTQARVPGLVATTTYIWQTVTCGDYIFFGTYDLTMTLAALFLALAEQLAEFDVASLALPEETELLFRDGAGAILLSLFLEKFITRSDMGFDIWYVPKDEVSTTWFRPLVLDGFRGLTPEDGSACGGTYWTRYDATAPVTEAVRQLVCHSQPDGSQPVLLAGSAVFDSRSSSTYVIRLDEECAAP